MPAPFPTDDTPPACRPTAAAVQAVLDGDLPAAALDADPHAADCADCRARLVEARVLLAALAVPPAPVAVPVGFAAGVLSAVRADRRVRRRRRVLAAAGGLAVAAAVLVAVWVQTPPGTPVVAEKAQPTTPPAPEPPAPPPVRVSAELAKAGEALRESSRPLAEPVAEAPRLFAELAGAMIPPLPAPMGENLGPAAESLAELPAAARTGLEPVAGTAQKAFARLIRDVGVVQTAARPKS